MQRVNRVMAAKGNKIHATSGLWNFTGLLHSSTNPALFQKTNSPIVCFGNKNMTMTSMDATTEDKSNLMFPKGCSWEVQSHIN